MTTKHAFLVTRSADGRVTDEQWLNFPNYIAPVSSAILSSAERARRQFANQKRRV